MDIQHISTPRAAAPGASYSQGVVSGELFFTAGFGPADPKTGAIVDGGIREQTEQTLDNLEALLEEVGLDFSDVVKFTVHLADLHRDFRDFDAAFQGRIASPYPARTTVGSTLWNILVEIDLVARMRVNG